MIRKLFHRDKPPCAKCPYTLGQVEFVRDPCPECKANNYATYHTLVDGRHKENSNIGKENPFESKN